MSRTAKTSPFTKVLYGICLLLAISGIVVILVLLFPDVLSPGSRESQEEVADAPAVRVRGSQSRFSNNLIKSEPFWMVGVSEFRMAPHGRLVWFTSDDRSKSLCWDISSGTIRQGYPDVLFFANNQDRAVGSDPQLGDALFSFRDDNSRASRKSIESFQWKPVLGQSSGDDQAAIFADDQYTSIIYSDGRRFDRQHDPISTELPTRWTSDLLHRYYFDDGSFHRYNELTGLDEVVYETPLEPAYKVSIAPDVGRAVIANGFQVELIDLENGKQIATTPIPLHRAIRDVQIAQSGNSAAVLLREHKTETELPGNIELFDLRGDSIKHHGTLPTFPSHMAIHRDGTHLCVYDSREVQQRCSLWDLGISEGVHRVDFASISAFVDPSLTDSVAESGPTETETDLPDPLDSVARIGKLQLKSPAFPFKLAKIQGAEDFSAFVVQAEHYLAGDLATWNTPAESITLIKTERANLVGMLQVSADGSVVACGGDVFDVATGQVASQLDSAENESGMTSFQNANLFSADGVQVLGINFGHCLLWDRSKNLVQSRGNFSEDQPESLYYFDATKDLSIAFAADQEGRLLEFDVARGRFTTLREKDNPIAHADICAKANRAALVEAGGGLIQLVDLASGAVETVLPIDGWSYLAVRLDQQGKRAIVTLKRRGTRDIELRYGVLDLSASPPEFLGILDLSPAEIGELSPMDISADGTRVAVGTDDQRINIFEIE